MKNIQFRILQGIKRGLSTPTLSKEMLEFQGRPLIRLLRVLGGLSILSLLAFSRNPSFAENLSNELRSLCLFVLLFIAFLYFLFHLYITYHRIKSIKSKLQSSDLDIRNSPLDRFSSMLARLMFCTKGVCESAAPIGLGLGILMGADQILRDGGREPFFGPLLGGGLNKILPKSDLDRWRDAYLEATKNLNQASKHDKIISDFLKKTAEFRDISIEDKKDLLELLGELKDASSEELESAKSKSIQLLAEAKNKRS